MMVPRADFVAVLSMLVKRATLLDRWRARTKPGHWLNIARRELMIDRGTSDGAHYIMNVLQRLMRAK